MSINELIEWLRKNDLLQYPKVKSDNSIPQNFSYGIDPDMVSKIQQESNKDAPKFTPSYDKARLEYELFKEYMTTPRRGVMPRRKSYLDAYDPAMWESNAKF